MSIYPQTLLLIVAVQITLGYLLVKNKLTFLAWPNLLFFLILTATLFFKATPILKMFALIAITLNAMKIVVTVNSYNDTAFRLGFFQWLVFTAGWVGMRLQSFKGLGGLAVPGAMRLLLTGLSRVLLGFVFLAAAHLAVKLFVAAPVIFVLTTGLILTGLSFILHFGLLSITAGFWRLFGADTYPLFRQPFKSNTLSEFWGRRWNLAFIEMLSIAVLRPLKAKIGGTTAVLVSFLFSGLMHEVAITLPVNAGFGMPTLYFTIQGFAVIAEKKMEKGNISVLKNKLFAKLWVLFWLIMPIHFLFPNPFIKQIVWPLAGLNVW